MKPLKILIPLTLFLTGCGGGSVGNLTAPSQPYVVAVEPASGSVVTSLTQVKVTLSQAVDPTSIHEKSFLIVEASVPETNPSDSVQLLKKIEEGEVTSLKGLYSVSADQKNITWTSSSLLEISASYRIVVTPTVRTEDHYPLTQTPLEGSTPFISEFTIKGFDGEGVSPGVNRNDPEGDAASLPKPDWIQINEIFYDPDGVEGDGQVFIEIYAQPLSDISGYLLRCVNGANGKKTDEILFPPGTRVPEDGFFVVADAKTKSDSETRVPHADLVSNFDPQNGPDSIQLIDTGGVLVDVIGYGEGSVEMDNENHHLFEDAPAPDAGAGQSLSRIQMADTGHNDRDFMITLPSPGEGWSRSLSTEAGKSESEARIEPSDENEGEEIDQNDKNGDETRPVEKEGVHFTEVVTDPQRDWNDSQGGNGIAFDSVVGNGSIGTTDEWIEVKNGSESVVDISEWRLEMIDGTDAVEFFDSSDAFFLFSDGGNLKNFHPEEFFVIGNAKGDLKNTVTLKIFDGDDQLVDELDVDDGNAESIDDESYQMTGNAEWTMDSASPGFE